MELVGVFVNYRYAALLLSYNNERDKQASLILRPRPPRFDKLRMPYYLLHRASQIKSSIIKVFKDKIRLIIRFK